MVDTAETEITKDSIPIGIDEDVALGCDGLR